MCVLLFEVSVEKGHELDHHTSLEQLINSMVSIGSGNVFIPSMRQGPDRQGLWGWQRKEDKVLYCTSKFTAMHVASF